jgi:hypothetical protein
VIGALERPGEFLLETQTLLDGSKTSLRPVNGAFGHRKAWLERCAKRMSALAPG